MTKKGYQKRLPTVLPPAVPRPRASIEDNDVVDEPDVVDGQDELPSARTVLQPRPAPASGHGQLSTQAVVGSRVGLVLLVGVLLFDVVVGVLLVTRLMGDTEPPLAEPGPGTVAVSRPPRMLAADESYVETMVQPDGEVVVHQWIEAGEPLRRLRLALPAVRGAEELSAAGVEVVADGVVVDGPDRITGRAATYVFAATTDVQVSYRLTGAVERSDSAAGRALALATSLDVTYEPRPLREIRVVRAPEVLALACSPSSEDSLVPCGQANGDDQWVLELTGPRIGDRVAAQLSLG